MQEDHPFTGPARRQNPIPWSEQTPECCCDDNERNTDTDIGFTGNDPDQVTPRRGFLH